MRTEFTDGNSQEKVEKRVNRGSRNSVNCSECLSLVFWIISCVFVIIDGLMGM